MHNLKLILASLVAIPLPAFATTAPSVPEPSVLMLAGVAGLVAAIVAVRRRK